MSKSLAKEYLKRAFKGRRTTIYVSNANYIDSENSTSINITERFVNSKG